MSDSGRPEDDKRGLCLFMDAVSGSRRRKSAPRRFYGGRDGDLDGGYLLMIKGPAIASRMPSDGWVGTRQELQGSPCESAATAPELHIVNGKSRPLFEYTFSTIPYSHSIVAGGLLDTS